MNEINFFKTSAEDTADTSDEIVMNDIPLPDVEGDLPLEVQEIFEEMQAGGTRGYSIYLKQFAEGHGNEAQAAVVDTFKNRAPSLDYIGVKHGPGKYVYQLSYKVNSGEITKGGHVRQKTVIKKEHIHIGDSYQDAHEDYVLAKKEQRIMKRKARSERLKAIKEINEAAGEAPPQGQTLDDLEDAVNKKIENTLAFATKLGFAGGNGKGFLNGLLQNMSPETAIAIGGLVIKFLDARDAKERRREEFMMQMMMQLSGRGSQGDGEEGLVKKLLEKIMDTKDFMAALTPEKQTAVDKIINLAESVLPHFIQLAAKPKSAIQADPMVGILNNSQEMGKMKDDPEMWRATVAGFDAKYGVDQSNELISVMQQSGNAWAHRPPEMDSSEYYDQLPEDFRPKGASTAKAYTPPEGGVDAGADGEDELAE